MAGAATRVHSPVLIVAMQHCLKNQTPAGIGAPRDGIEVGRVPSSSNERQSRLPVEGWRIQDDLPGGHRRKHNLFTDSGTSP